LKVTEVGEWEKGREGEERRKTGRNSHADKTLEVCPARLMEDGDAVSLKSC